MDWAARHCVPSARARAVGAEEADRILAAFRGWERRGERLHKRFRFRDFREAMRFVGAMADLAESQGHHPDFSVHWAEVDVELWTHSAGGLSENDFVLAAGIDALPAAGEAGRS